MCSRSEYLCIKYKIMILAYCLLFQKAPTYLITVQKPNNTWHRNWSSLHTDFIMEDQVNELTQCSICLDTFTQPKMLPCQHTFCHSCLVDMTRTGSERNITCPQCRKVHPLPANGVSDFSNNILLK